MKSIRLCVLATCATLAVPATGQDASSIWNSLQQPAFSADKSASVSQLALVRDRIRITLANGIVFGATFRGRGRVQVEPPNALEAQQLRLLSRQDTLDMEFSEAVFVFLDDTFAEVSRQV